MKKLLCVILVMAMLFILAECGGAQSSGSKVFKIGFSVNDFNDKWVSYVLDAVKAWDEARPDVEVILGNSQTDVQKQMADVETWITQKFDAICVKPVEVSATIVLANECKEAGIPYVAVQQPIKEATARCLQDSVRTGETQMQAVIDMLGGKGKVAILMGEPGTLVATQRIEGNKNILAKYPDVELVVIEVANWQRDQGMKIMETWIQSGLKVDAIVASNDEAAIGAILALEAAGIRDKYIVAGIDATPDALKFMKEGRLDITMFADAKKLGEESLNLAMKLIKEGKADDVVISDLLVLPKDVDKYLK